MNEFQKRFEIAVKKYLNNLKRKAKKNHFDTYQEMSTYFNLDIEKGDK